MWAWIKEKWQIVTGAVVTLFAALFILLRMGTNEKKQKEILEKANESHKAELKAHKDAATRLAAGDQEIEANSKRKMSEIDKQATAEEKKLESEKRDFIHSSKASDDLAKKLAAAIGAEFVDSSDD